MTGFTRSLLIAGLVLAPGPLAAQSSIFSVLGIGFPIQPLDVRARSMGGSVAAVEPRAAVNPAAVAAFQRLTVVINTETRVRSHQFGGVDASGLQETRFPFALTGGRFRGTPIAFALSFATYADRSYDITATDTVTPRGEPIAVSHRIGSRGAIADLRGAVAWSVSPRMALGLGVHVLSGSARRTTRSTFEDPYYTNLSYQEDEAYSGFGVSVGATLAPTGGLRIGAAVRKDGTLNVSTEERSLGSYTLPTTVTGGILALLSPNARVAANATWRSWSDTQGDLVDERAFDTWSVGSGLELSRFIGGLPLRLGARYETLPFSPADDQPRDVTVALGSGLQFAGNRAIADLTLERSFREGGGATERGWSLSAAIVVVP